jgi:protein ImuB
VGVRTLVSWCPDWPVVAAVRAAAVPGLGEHLPVAVLAAGRVYACSEAARAEGVRRGMRRRDAQGRCPELLVVEHDPGRDVRMFEPVLAAVEEVAPGVEVTAAGRCALAARGPAGYFGGEDAAAERIIDQIARCCGVEAQVGVADGVFAAELAARAGAIVAPGGSAAFLAGLDVRVLGRPELVGLLRRLGIRTLGGFAALPAADVAGRFGADAALAHRLAGGGEERALAPRELPPELSVRLDPDPAIDRVDVAAFAARTLAERLHERLARHGLAATRLIIEARTGHAEELSRTWRHDGVLTVADIADRTRWQLEGWLSGTGPDARPTAGIARLRLCPEGVVEYAGLQLGLWGDTGEARDRAHRAITRVQGLLGPDAVLVPVLTGGRGPADRVQLVPWGDERPDDPDRTTKKGKKKHEKEVAPWPGRLPAPSPAVVPPEPWPAVVVDAGGGPVGVTGRFLVSAAPAAVAVDGAEPVAVAGWAGPWPAEERWWDPDGAGRRARLQVRLADGRALLLVVTGGRWAVEAEYD